MLNNDGYLYPADGAWEVTQVGDTERKYVKGHYPFHNEEPVRQVSELGGQGSSSKIVWTGDKTYEIHDSGSKATYDDGMQRDNTAGKPRFDLMYPREVPYEEQLLTRVAMQYSVGGEKYGDRNWEKSSSEESLAHHEAALMRHVIKYLTGVDDGEDHGAAIVWNVNAVDLTRRNIAKNDGRERVEYSGLSGRAAPEADKWYSASEGTYRPYPEVSYYSMAYPDKTPIYDWPEAAEER